MIKAKYFTFYSVPHNWSTSKVKLFHTTSFIGTEGFSSCLCEGQSRNQLMDFFHDSKSRECSHIFRSYYWWWLYAGLFFFPFPHLGKFYSSAFSGKCNGWALWMTAMNNWCCECSLPTDSGPKSLLQFYDSNLSYNSFPFLPVTAEKRVHIIRSSPRFPVSH